MTTEGRLVVTRSMLRVPIALIAVGVVTTVIGLIVAPTRTWLNLVVDGFYALAIAVGAILFFATQRLSSAKWSATIRRVPEAFMQVMPAAAVMMIVLFFGLHAIYPWAGHHAEGHHVKHMVEPGANTWYVPAFVYVRMAVVLVVWTLFAWGIRRTSLAADADREAGLRAHSRLNRWGAVFACVFAVTITTASYDWLISFDPNWLSTMFSVYVFAGTFVLSIASIGLVTVVLTRRGSFGPRGKLIGSEPIHTLGTMLLAFCTFWAYIWVCQYLLIWYGNIPEEVTWYLRRTSGPWLPLFLLSFVINWIIPFFALLPRTSKRSLKIMMTICILVLVGRWLDLYILVMPAHWDAPRIGPLEIGMAAGTVGLIYVVVVRALSRAPLVPTHDPVIAMRRAHAHEGGPS